MDIGGSGVRGREGNAVAVPGARGPRDAPAPEAQAQAAATQAAVGPAGPGLGEATAEELFELIDSEFGKR